MAGNDINDPPPAIAFITPAISEATTSHIKCQCELKPENIQFPLYPLHRAIDLIPLHGYNFSHVGLESSPRSHQSPLCPHRLHRHSGHWMAHWTAPDVSLEHPPEAPRISTIRFTAVLLGLR